MRAQNAHPSDRDVHRGLQFAAEDRPREFMADGHVRHVEVVALQQRGVSLVLEGRERGLIEAAAHSHGRV